MRLICIMFETHANYTRRINLTWPFQQIAREHFLAAQLLMILKILFRSRYDITASEPSVNWTHYYNYRWIIGNKNRVERISSTRPWSSTSSRRRENSLFIDCLLVEERLEIDLPIKKPTIFRGAIKWEGKIPDAFFTLKNSESVEWRISRKIHVKWSRFTFCTLTFFQGRSKPCTPSQV